MSKAFCAPLLILASVALPGCGPDPAGDTQELAANLSQAEGMIDAFYSFEPDKLRPYLIQAGEAQAAILYYQGWAEGGNYKVLERAPCEPVSADTIDCAITVQDDPVLALQTGFNVTDTFTLTFADGNIVNVETSSNDQPIYYEARAWVRENMPEVVSGPCKDAYQGGTTPGDCARAMTEGYKKFMDARSAEADDDLEASTSFVPQSFVPPVLVEADQFKLVPLGPDLVDIDYAAYMSSIDHLQQTFTRSTSWPHENISAEDAMQDMLNEQARFNARESFAYAVLSQDGTTERGCIYVRPSSKPGYDAEVALWVTKAEYDAGFDQTLYAWTQGWVSRNWPFDTVAYPGRAISWSDWE